MSYHFVPNAERSEGSDNKASLEVVSISYQSAISSFTSEGNPNSISILNNLDHIIYSDDNFDIIDDGEIKVTMVKVTGDYSIEANSYYEYGVYGEQKVKENTSTIFAKMVPETEEIVMLPTNETTKLNTGEVIMLSPSILSEGFEVENGKAIFAVTHFKIYKL